MSEIKMSNLPEVEPRYDTSLLGTTDGRSHKMKVGDLKTTPIERYRNKIYDEGFADGFSAGEYSNISFLRIVLDRLDTFKREFPILYKSVIEGEFNEQSD